MIVDGPGLFSEPVLGFRAHISFGTWGRRHVGLDTYRVGVFLVVGTPLPAILGLLGVRKLLRKQDLISYHDVGGYLLSVVGTLYAVILGLIVVDSMGNFQEAHLTTEQEANSLANVLILANHLPREKREAIQKYGRDYVKYVLNEEWTAMDEGQHSPKASSSRDPPFQRGLRLRAEDREGEGNLRHAAHVPLPVLGQPADLDRHRGARCFTLEWFVLLVGGAVTVAFTLLLQTRKPADPDRHDGDGLDLIALNLFLVLMFGYPFSGDHRVSLRRIPSGRRAYRRTARRGPEDPGRRIALSVRRGEATGPETVCRSPLRYGGNRESDLMSISRQVVPAEEGLRVPPCCSVARRGW